MAHNGLLKWYYRLESNSNWWLWARIKDTQKTIDQSKNELFYIILKECRSQPYDAQAPILTHFKVYCVIGWFSSLWSGLS